MTTPTRSTTTSSSDALALTKAARQAGDASAAGPAARAAIPTADHYEIGHVVDSADAMTPGRFVPPPPILPTPPGPITLTERHVPEIKDGHVIKLPNPQSRIGKPVWSAMERYPKTSSRLIGAWGNFLEFAPSALATASFALSSYSLAENWNKLTWQQRTINTTATAAMGVGAGTGLAATIISRVATAKAMAAAIPASALDASPAMARAAMLGKVGAVSMGLAGTILMGAKVYNDFHDSSKNNVQRAFSATSAALMTGSTVMGFLPHGRLWSYGLLAAGTLVGLVGSWVDRFVFNKKKRTKRQMVFGVIATAAEGTAYVADQSKGRIKHIAYPLDKADKILVKEAGG